MVNDDSLKEKTIIVIISLITIITKNNTILIIIITITMIMIDNVINNKLKMSHTVMSLYLVLNERWLHEGEEQKQNKIESNEV